MLKMKKLLSVVLAMGLLLSTNQTVLAHEGLETEMYLKNPDATTHNEILEWLDENSTSTKVTINEFEVLQQLNTDYLNNKNTRQFEAMPVETLDTILNYTEFYENKIYDLQQYSEQDLQNLNYTESQIYAIENFDGSDEMMMAASTSVDVDAGFRNKEYTSNGGTKVDLIVAFNSHGIQSNWMNDIFSVVWSEPLTVSSATGTVRYMSTYGEEDSYYNHTPRAGGVYAREIEFSKYKSSSPAHYVHSGSMVIELKSNDRVVDFAAYAAYGYATITFNGVGVSYPGGLSITFGKGMTKAGQAYASL